MLFDCPGQIELYSHCSVFRTFVEYLRRQGWSIAAVYCIDCQFVAEPAKFVAGALQARSTCFGSAIAAGGEAGGAPVAGALQACSSLLWLGE